MQSVSVVIPSFNHARYITKAIASVIEQDYPALELIIIDDGSTDGSAAVIRDAIAHIQGRRVVFHEQPNAGAHAAIMRGLSLAKGDVLTILNSDDHYEPARFTTVLGAAPHSGDFIAFTKVRFIDDSGRPMPPDSESCLWYAAALRQAAECPTVGYGLLRNNFAVTSGNLIFSRSLYDRLGGFAAYRLCHDWDFLMRATHWVEPRYIQQPLMAYRSHAKNTVHSTRHLLIKEGVPAINTFIELGRKQNPPNKLAPGRANWPTYFDYFIDTHSSWFSPDPIRGFIDAGPPAAPRTSTWVDTDLNFIAADDALPADLDAFALRRQLNLKSMPPSSPSAAPFLARLKRAPAGVRRRVNKLLQRHFAGRVGS